MTETKRGVSFRKILALAAGGLATAVVHFIIEFSAVVSIGPLSKVYPLLKDLAPQTMWSYISVFLLQGFFTALAFLLVENSFSRFGKMKKGLRFGFVLWILSAVVPLLPMFELYKIDLTPTHILIGLTSGFFLSEIMGVFFVLVYQGLWKEKTLRKNPAASRESPIDSPYRED